MKSPSRSVFWVAADLGGVTAVSMLSMLAMARLIGPEEFGIGAIAVGLVQLVNLYVEGLLHDALIQREEAPEEAFEDAFWFSVGLGLCLFVVAIAVWLLLRDTSFEHLSALIACTATALPFGGMVGVMNAKLRRSHDYRVVAAPSLASRIISAVAAVLAAWLGAGAWSFPVSLVTGFAVQGVGLLLVAKWRPRFRGSIATLRPLWRFALPMALMHTLVGLRIQGFTALMATFGGLAAAGHINVAYRLALTPQVLLSTALTNLGLPLLARHQTARDDLVAAYQQLNKMVAATLTPTFIGLAVCADILVAVVLGAQWIPSTVPMQIFAVGAAIYLTRVPSALLLRALGHVRYSVMNSIMHLVLTLGGMLVFHPRTAVGASLLWVAPLVPLVPLTLYVLRKELKLSLAEQLGGLAAPYASAAGMAVCVVAVRTLLSGTTPLLTLVVCVGTGVTVYGLLLFALDGRMRRLILSRLRLTRQREV